MTQQHGDTSTYIRKERVLDYCEKNTRMYIHTYMISNFPFRHAADKHYSQHMPTTTLMPIDNGREHAKFLQQRLLHKPRPTPLQQIIDMVRNTTRRRKGTRG